MKNVTILFFGQLKALWDTDSIDTKTACITVEELYQSLLTSASEPPVKNSIRVAINDEFSHWEALINEGDVIAFLPPSSGG